LYRNYDEGGVLFGSQQKDFQEQNWIGRRLGTRNKNHVMEMAKMQGY
jgi:hypothetical protein